MGLSNTFATIPGLVVPSLVGSLIHKQVKTNALKIFYFKNHTNY